ncbi:hypothetical protein AEP_01627 [Curvibacter sp. AEP1-3]|nr:hypothetical protein AEP_01627 [Curvibacter sp. AEP1-3]
MIYLKPRQVGKLVKHKRGDRLYAEAGLQVKMLRRKKIAFQTGILLSGRPVANQV